MSKKALIIVDFQKDYFPGGRWLLQGIEGAADNAVRALAHARARQDLVVHIRHEFTAPDAPFFTPGSEGAQAHPPLTEQAGEPVIIKNEVNAFKNTQLHELLQRNGIGHLVIVGNMSHVCVDAIVRAGADLGYTITVLHDACATHDQTFNDTTVPAAQVQAAFMAGLAFGYARVISTQEHLSTAA